MPGDKIILSQLEMFDKAGLLLQNPSLGGFGKLFARRICTFRNFVVNYSSLRNTQPAGGRANVAGKTGSAAQRHLYSRAFAGNLSGCANGGAHAPWWESFPPDCVKKPETRPDFIAFRPCRTENFLTSLRTFSGRYVFLKAAIGKLN
ncbi:MAG: hypothetical protein HFG02_05420 [Oscillibacter sp.]|nr:hypothetical protein [Oscillibacter sp.]